VINTVDELIQSRPGAEGIQSANLNEAIKIDEFIVMSSGTSNAYMVLVNGGRVIINTGMGFEALTHKKLFDEVSTLPTRYIFLTQGHVDHVGGVQQFKEEGTEVVAQVNNPVCQRDDLRIESLRQSQSYIWFDHVIDQALEVAKDHPEVFLQDKPIADILFDDYLQLTVGGIDFDLISLPGGETIDSCGVWLPEHRILFSGNIFGPLFPHFPNFNTLRGDKYRFVEPYLESLKKVRELNPEMLITGHFDPIVGSDLIQACLQRLERAVTYVHEETLKGMNAGKDVYTLMNEIHLPDEFNVGQGYGKVSWAVRTIWESYIGWFHLKSTTELYEKPVTSIYADLAKLATPKSLIHQGQLKLVEGEYQQAIHFAEIILAGDNKNKQALALSFAAHKDLLEQDSTNFWLKGWLEKQIQNLQQALNEVMEMPAYQEKAPVGEE